MSGTAAAMLYGSDPRRRPLLSHLVRRRALQGQRVKIHSDLVKKAFAPDTRYPTAIEQVENLLIYLAENVPQPGQPVDIDIGTFQAIIAAATADTFRWVVKTTKDRGWIDGIQQSAKDSFALARASLTLDGWTWYEDRGRHKRSRLAFMAMPFGFPDLDALVANHFAPAVGATGFDLRRLDHAPQAGIIDNRLRVEIRRSRLLLCDVTHGNQGAYWEAGFAEGIGLPVIYTCEASVLAAKKVHFDARNFLVVSWELGREKEAVELLKAAIRNTLPEEALLADPP